MKYRKSVIREDCRTLVEAKEGGGWDGPSTDYELVVLSSSYWWQFTTGWACVGERTCSILLINYCCHWRCRSLASLPFPLPATRTMVMASWTFFAPRSRFCYLGANFRSTRWFFLFSVNKSFKLILCSNRSSKVTDVRSKHRFSRSLKQTAKLLFKTMDFSNCIESRPWSSPCYLRRTSILFRYTLLSWPLFFDIVPRF